MSFVRVKSGCRDIAYRDEHITVIFNRTTGSQKLMVTFGDMINLAVGDKAWGERVSVKSGMDNLCFMASARNWFPASSMTKAIKFLSQDISLYSEKICYGGSMGGYAAIKYSRMISADRTISITPQYSIDPADVKDSGYSKYFNPALNAGMAITHADVGGEILIISDPGFKPDEAHVKKIAAAVPDIRRINLRGVDHHASSVLAGSDFFNCAIYATSTKSDVAKLYTVMRSKRKSHRAAASVLLWKLLRKRPEVVSRWIKNFDNSDDYWEDFLFKFFVQQLARTDPAWMRVEPLIKSAIRERLGLSSSRDVRFLVSAHRGILCRGGDGRFTTLPLLVARAEEGHKKPVEVTEVEIASGTKSLDQKKVDLVLEQHHLSIRCDGRYLSSFPDGRAAFVSRKKSAWEQFKLI